MWDLVVFFWNPKGMGAGKFLQLSVIKNGRRSFVIFPAGWNDRGWTRIFDVLNEIISSPNRGLGGEYRVSLPQGALLNKALPPPLPPPPSLGCCPKCGFLGEPSCFLQTSLQASSKESWRYAGGAVKQPSSSKELQEFRGGQQGSSSSSFNKCSAPFERTQVFFL